MAGDVHGDEGWAEKLCKAARQQSCSQIAQVGDFGYWEHTAAGREYLDRWSDLCDEYGLNLTWLDGNHENHTLLRSKYEVHPDLGWAKIREHVYYASRGARWRWDDVSFLALGGAYSIDKNWRKPGMSWWPEELITSEEAELAASGGYADVMLTHDCPLGVDVLGSHHDNDFRLFPESQRNRQYLLDVVKKVRPQYLFHGHYHVRNRDRLTFPYDTDDGSMRWHETRIEGLGCDWMGELAYSVFDTTVFKKQAA